MRILCAIDFSPQSDNALAQAAALARRFGAELHLLHAYGLPVAALPEGAMMTGPVQAAEMASLADEELHRREAHYPDLDLARHVVVGAPSDEILRVADEIDAAYIVMGTHGRTGLRHLLMGSVAEQVIRRAKVPVLTVPQRAKAVRAA